MFLEFVGKVISWVEKRNVSNSLVPTTPFISDKVFPWGQTIEARWPDIRKELNAVLAYRDELPNFQEISEEQSFLTQDDKWKTFFFYGYGFKSEENLKKCPKTAEALSNIPGMTTAFFSVLAPGKQLPEHRGPYNGVLRYHLGLKIPEPVDACGIKVGGETRHWQDGVGMFFDDTYRHSAWNKTEEDRVVLFVDFLRPLSFPFNYVNRFIVWAISKTPFIKNARKNQEAWEERFEQMRAERNNG